MLSRHVAKLKKKMTYGECGGRCANAAEADYNNARQASSCISIRRYGTSRQIFYYIYDNFTPHAVLPYCLLRGISGILCRTLSQWLDPCYAGSSVSTARLKANAFHSRAFHVRLRVHSSLPFTHPLLKPNRPQHTTPTATRQFGKLSSPTLSFLLPTPISCSQTSPKSPY